MEKNIDYILNSASIERDFNLLQGILTGTNFDGIINEMEIVALKNWVSNVNPYQNRQPYYEVILLLNEIIETGKCSSQDIDDILWFINSKSTRRNYYTLDNNKRQILIGIICGIIADDHININEFIQLEKWMAENTNLAGTFPYDEIKRTLELKNTSFLQEHLLNLKQIFESFTSEDSDNSNNNLIKFLEENLYQNEVFFDNMNFCVTGKSGIYLRKDIELMILERGGKICGVSKKLDYLVICNEKSNAWTLGVYGNKIEKLIKLKEEGINIKILTETHLINA
ncbi:MAG: BRCT domain-containing protein [Bacteroidia bacterium]|nr:BRCT domain-containing protein [Bacteroidia bacterium]